MTKIYSSKKKILKCVCSENETTFPRKKTTGLLMTLLPEDLRACAVEPNARSRERATAQTALKNEMAGLPRRIIKV